MVDGANQGLKAVREYRAHNSAGGEEYDSGANSGVDADQWEMDSSPSCLF